MSEKKKGAKQHEERDPETGLIYINSVDDIPYFSSEEEELEFWETHEPTMTFFGPKPKALAEALAEARARKHPAERYRPRGVPARPEESADGWVRRPRARLIASLPPQPP